jgi:hypothetical protein
MRRDILQKSTDPRSRAIIALIAFLTMTPNSTAANFSTTGQAVSKCLHFLSECKLVHQVQEGIEIFYSLEISKMKEIDHWLGQFRKIWEKRFNQLDHLLSTIKKDKK